MRRHCQRQQQLLNIHIPRPMSDTPDSSNGQVPEQRNRRAPSSRQRPAQKAQQQREKQQPRTVNPVLERLFELYPKLFGAQFLPLKLGVFHDLMARHPDDFKKDDLKIAMGQHARSTRYLESVAAGHQRHDLDGQPIEAVAPEHVHHAIVEVFRRRQARSKEDLRPRLKLRLMDAIEASGLSLDDYAERMRAQDETLNAVLDDALADLKLEAAKREALVRTFTASGRTVEEFCDMYGMNPGDVTRALARVRDEQAVRAAHAANPSSPGKSTSTATADVDAPESEASALSSTADAIPPSQDTPALRADASQA
jgi:ProP effector